MTTETASQSLSLERPPHGELLALIEKVIENPHVDAEKLRVIVELKLSLDDRAAAKAFDAAMQEAQKEVEALRWDKINRDSNQSRWVSFPKIDAMLKPIREKYGFTETFGVEPELPAPNTMLMYSDVIHEGGHRRRYHLPMSISGEGPKGGGVMTAAQAVGNGTSYGMRYLEKLIWKIPMLVDKDDNDGNAVRPTLNEQQVKELNKLYGKLSPEKQKQVFEFLAQRFKVEISGLADIPSSKFNESQQVLAKALRGESEVQTVSEDQVATLQAILDELSSADRADFLKTNKVKKLSELPASQYQMCLRGLEMKRRG